MDIYNEDEYYDTIINIPKFYSVEDYASCMITNNNGVIDTNDIENLSKLLWHEWKSYIERVQQKLHMLIWYMLGYQYQDQTVETSQYMAIHLTQLVTDLQLDYEEDPSDHSPIWNFGLSDVFTSDNYQKIYLEERKELELEDISPAEIPYNIESIMGCTGVFKLFTFLEDNAETEYIRKLLYRMLEYKDLFVVIGR